MWWWSWGRCSSFRRSITAADYMAYLLYVNTLLTSIRRIVDFMEQFQRGITGIERFCEIMDETPEIQDAPDAVELTHVRGDVTFDHVSFHLQRRRQKRVG